MAPTQASVRMITLAVFVLCAVPMSRAQPWALLTKPPSPSTTTELTTTEPTTTEPTTTPAVHDDKCYRFSDDSLSHKEAAAACANMGGQLADVMDTRDHLMLADNIHKTTDVSHWTVIKSPSPNVIHSDGTSLFALSPWMSENTYGPFDVCVLLDSTDGYKGDYRACTEQHNYVCESSVVPCDHAVCQNRGNCTSCFSNSTMCDCLPGYTGGLCQTDVDECASIPCQNGGSCIDHVNSFSCICTRGYTGSFCESDINFCDPNPCPFDWICVDDVALFHCQLPAKKITTPPFCTASACGPGWYCRENGPAGYSCIRG